MANDLTTAFEQVFSEMYGVKFVDVTPTNICPMKMNCGRTGWPDGETECKGCGLEANPDTDDED